MSALLRHFSCWGLVGLALLSARLPAEEVPSAVSAPAKRHELLERAKSTLAAQTTTLPADLANPFNPPAFAELMGTARRATGTPTTATTGAVADNPSVKVPGGVKTDRDIIEAIAAGLKPSGSYVIGGEPTLVFGQKRVKAGGHLTITFEGTEYTLEIVSIERPNFTLRLNREEFTRPIK